MAGSPSTTIVQLFNDWEIELLIILSFSLQLFLFFVGSLRSRNNHILLQLPLWLAYLSADSVAIYALGYLSRHLPTTTDNDYAMSNQTQLLKLLWAPFILVHLGGQDTLTAFSIEDNELWLRHMLNLLVQVSLVLWVLCKSVAAYDRLAVPAIFVFVTGIIKYGERIWALKWGSQKSLKSSSRREVVQSQSLPVVLQQTGGTTELTYPIVVKRALHYEEDVRNLFVGRTLIHRKSQDPFNYFDEQYYGEGNGSELFFKGLEVELSIMYDLLFTKSRIIHTTLGTILRCVSLTSTMVAFVLFIVMGARQTYKFSIVDTTITYILFIGAVCLEGCSVFILMMSPQTWATLEARRCCVLARVAWFILVKMQPETRPWWSNSMGQYNLVSSCIADKKSGIFFTAITKMVGIELWNKIRHIKYVQVPIWIKQLMDRTFDLSKLHTLNLHASMHQFLVVIHALTFETALLVLHVWTERLIQKMGVSVIDIPEETKKLMDQCKGISDYMIYLLVVNPAMLPVNSSVVDELVANFKKNIQVMNDEQFREAAVYDLLDKTSREILHIESWMEHTEILLLQEQGGLHAFFGELVQVWVRLLMHAADKCRPEQHARRLAMGGELLTFVWLGMLHRGLGDQGCCDLSLLWHQKIYQKIQVVPVRSAHLSLRA